jgi:hypothetical protein
METLLGLYHLKEDPIKGKKYDHPAQYLGADIDTDHYHCDDDTKKPCWYIMSVNTYEKNAITTAVEHLDQQGLKLKTKVTAMFPAGYRPKYDISKELNDKGAN